MVPARYSGGRRKNKRHLEDRRINLTVTPGGCKGKHAMEELLEPSEPKVIFFERERLG